MPCFIRQIRRLGISVPDKISLFSPEDTERIEEEMEKALNVKSHEELHEKIEEFTDMKKEDELKKIIEGVLAKIQEEKEKSKYPDRFKELRKKWKEAYTVAPAPAS